jgi:hypothetical protein
MNLCRYLSYQRITRALRLGLQVFFLTRREVDDFLPGKAEWWQREYLRLAAPLSYSSQTHYKG